MRGQGRLAGGKHVGKAVFSGAQGGVEFAEQAVAADGLNPRRRDIGQLKSGGRVAVEGRLLPVKSARDGEECASIGTTPRVRRPPTRRSRSRPPRARSATPTVRWCSRSRGSRCPRAGARSPPTCLRRNISARRACPRASRRSRRTPSPRSCGAPSPDEAALEALPKAERYGSETSARQVFDRLAGAWAYWGWKGGYFDGEEDARAYFDEMRYMLARQIAAPNSPQWFNTGLHWAYGIDGPGPGPLLRRLRDGQADASRSRPTSIRSRTPASSSRVADDLVNDGGIMDLWVREARLFKYGSGTGSNFSALRGENEKLSGGGRSSGLMSLPEDRRPRGGRDQVGRHDAARGENGRRRRRSPRHRGLYRLEGEGGAEGRRAGDRLEDRQAPPQGDPARPASIARARATTASTRRRTRR